MATRSIVTSQPDVACDVCERRLLRGEQPDLFIDAGQPRMVCELCAPRAAHQGWKRGSAEPAASAVPLRSRRARGLFERLRATRQATPETARRVARDTYAPLRDDAPAPFGFAAAGPAAGASAPVGEGVAPPIDSATDATQVQAGRSGGPLLQAIAVFNAGEYPRRVASLTRSLGTPEVSVRPGEAVASSVVIVIAWELCWYTYEVDLDDMQGPQSRAIAQGTELSELGPHDRLANALADERGSLALL
ncbi:MAG TPA: hypothetical protein VK605_02430 [Solirubrobacteraceae bacterium]|nr:hypothetical protein [Solirubrobacteraceae bacterium]